MSVRRGLFWPLLLVVIGLVFLMANLGYIGTLSVLALANLWPIILVLIGIDVAFGRRWPLGVLVADVAIIAGALALVSYAPNLPTGAFILSNPGDSVVSQPRSDVKTLNLRLAGGAGTYSVKGGADPADLVHVTSDAPDLHLRSSIRTGDRADVRIEENVDGVHFGPRTSNHVDALIASDVTTSLRLDVGAGEFVVDLSNVKLSDASVNAGAASLRIVAPTPTGDVPITVSSGASSVVIEVPAGVEARVTVSGGLSSTRFENPRFTGSETSGYAAAKDRVTIKVTAGASSVVVR
ncbi:MAG TPA: DUF5668 domain-containing protein [Candidatus Acidoferrales bacterium]|nr:DUF5668 domain-containing protein [Candidatus Acidoferrales bacterium]